MRLVDIDDIRVMKFLSEEDDPSESDGEREYRNGWNDALTAINDIQPSAQPSYSCSNEKDAQPKKGKWIYGENDCQDGWFCSECRFFIPWDYDYYGLNNIDFIKDFHVCPHCKAEMVTYTGKKEDTDEHSG